MNTAQAVSLFEKNWFLRHEEKLDLRVAEQQFIAASTGPAPKRWDGEPDVHRMTEILAGEPGVLDRIGTRLLQVLIGMRGCGPAVGFLVDRGVPLEIDMSSYNVLHEAAWGGMVDTLRGGLRIGCGGRDVRFGKKAARRVARQPFADVLGGSRRVPGVSQPFDPVRRRRSPRTAD